MEWAGLRTRLEGLSLLCIVKRTLNGAVDKERPKPVGYLVTGAAGAAGAAGLADGAASFGLRVFLTNLASSWPI